MTFIDFIPRAKALYSQLYRFMMKHVYPMEEILYGKFRLAKDRWVVHPEIESMKALAKKEFVIFACLFFWLVGCDC